jgi:hypothetical protein
MDWQHLLVHDGQAIVISTGVIVGMIALVSYRIKARWGIHDEERAHKREEFERAQAWLQGEMK